MEKNFTLVHILIATLVFGSEIAFARRTQSSADASGGYYTVYRYDAAATGSCMPNRGANPSGALQRNGIRTVGNPNAAEIAALSRGLAQVENLLGAPLPQGWRQNYNFMYATGAWNQGAATINIRRPRGSNQGTNVGRLMHELGHKVGNSGVYQKYASFTGRTRCAITGYAKTKFNEEFAEVFAAYVTYPDLLVKKCPKAFSFMSTQLFPNSSNKIASCDGSSIASNDSDSDSDSDSSSRIPTPTPRPSDIDTLSEEESQDDVVVTPDNGDDEEDYDDREESGGIGLGGAAIGAAGLLIPAVMMMSGGDDDDDKKREPATSPGQVTQNASGTVNIPIPTPRPDTANEEVKVEEKNIAADSVPVLTPSPASVDVKEEASDAEDEESDIGGVPVPVPQAKPAANIKIIHRD